MRIPHWPGAQAENINMEWIPDPHSILVGPVKGPTRATSVLCPALPPLSVLCPSVLCPEEEERRGDSRRGREEEERAVRRAKGGARKETGGATGRTARE